MKRLGTSYILWFCRTSGNVSPSLFEPYNLNHVSVFLLLLPVLLAFVLVGPEHEPKNPKNLEAISFREFF
jgi:hypothetical protein